MSQMQTKFGTENFRVIAVNGWDEPKETIERFVNKEGLKQTVLLMGGKIADEIFGVRSYPTSFLIDHHGKILSREVGFNPVRIPQVEKHIAELLAEKKREAKAQKKS